MVKMDPPELVPLGTNFRRGHVTNRGVWRREVIQNYSSQIII